MNEVLLNQIYQIYSKNKIGSNEICLKCKEYAIKKGKKLRQGPVPILHIGKDYGTKKKRLLFVGLVAYGWDDVLAIDGKNVDNTWDKINNNNLEIIRKTYTAVETKIKQLFNEERENIKFLRAIKQATTKIFGDEIKAFDNIAITNFVHCNSNSVKDNLPQFVRKSCADLNYLGLLFKEIKILNPTHIVILTQSNKYIGFLPPFDKYKLKCIKHPSAIGRNRSEFIEEIRSFYYSV